MYRRWSMRLPQVIAKIRLNLSAIQSGADSPRIATLWKTLNFSAIRRVSVPDKLRADGGRGRFRIFRALSEQRDSAMTDFCGSLTMRSCASATPVCFPSAMSEIIPDFAEVKQFQLALLQLVADRGALAVPLDLSELPFCGAGRFRNDAYGPMACYMGESQLGSGCAFGGFHRVPVGIDVRLLCEDVEPPNGKPGACGRAAGSA